MVDRRQEAITIMREFLFVAYNTGIGRKPHDSWTRGEVLYDRLTTLREFPEEEIWFAITGSQSAGETLQIIERLWHGQEAKEGKDYPFNTLVDRNAEHKNAVAARGLALVQKKGGCPKCGGSGKRCTIYHCEYYRYHKVTPKGKISCQCDYGKVEHCPACKGTGERRKGERRKAIERRGYDSSLSSAGCTPEGPYGRRDGEERRK